MRYPTKVEPANGDEFIATCRDIPEALTAGSTREEALFEMRDALGAAVAGYVMKEDRYPPSPSHVFPGEHLVSVNPLVVAKLEARISIKEKGVSIESLAGQTGLTEREVVEVMDLDHESAWPAVHAVRLVLGLPTSQTGSDAKIVLK